MAVLPQDKRGQMLLMTAIIGGALLYFASCGPPIGETPGVGRLGVVRDSLQRELDSLNIQVRNARQDVASGAIQQLEARLAEYRGSLDLMRTLVPAGTEIPNLLDDISSRARVRGANVNSLVPQGVESGVPFDIQRARVTITGSYDQIGEYLADIASLPRIVVPYDLRLVRITSPTADSALRAQGTMLAASFQIKTFVKPAFVDTTAVPVRGGTQ